MSITGCMKGNEGNGHQHNNNDTGPLVENEVIVVFILTSTTSQYWVQCNYTSLLQVSDKGGSLFSVDSTKPMSLMKCKLGPKCEEDHFCLGMLHKNLILPHKLRCDCSEGYIPKKKKSFGLHSASLQNIGCKTNIEQVGYLMGLAVHLLMSSGVDLR
jgi:hypothetical protein